MTDYILPALLLLIFILLTIKNLPAYDYFTEGAKGAIDLCIGVFPYLAAMLISVALLRISGIAEHLSRLTAPVMGFFGIPSELAELTLLRPFSGSGSLALFNEIIAQYGADSYTTRCAAVIMGSSETVFYVAGVYFASSKARKLRYALPVALISCFLSVIISCFVVRFL